MSKKRKTPTTTRMNARKVEAPKVVTRPTTDVELAHDDIAHLAYARFLARGGVHGFHVEDWFAAEAALRARSGT
jgi:hypothetical protein